MSAPTIPIPPTPPPALGSSTPKISIFRFSQKGLLNDIIKALDAPPRGMEVFEPWNSAIKSAVSSSNAKAVTVDAHGHNDPQTGKTVINITISPLF